MVENVGEADGDVEFNRRRLFPSGDVERVRAGDMRDIETH